MARMLIVQTPYPEQVFHRLLQVWHDTGTSQPAYPFPSELGDCSDYKIAV